MSFDFRSRTLAASIHAGGSLAVGALAAALVFLLWYPWPYSVLAGGTGLFVLVVGVDVVIGPVITFSIFDRSKGWPVLRRDLAVILLLQACALGYGLHTVFVARPVALVLETHRFRVIRAVDLVTQELPLAPEGLRQLPLGGPRVLRTEVPTDANERLEAIVAATAGVDLGQRPKYWRAWDDEARRETLANARPLADIVRYDPKQRPQLDAAVARSGRSEAELRYLPLLAKFGEWVALIDANSGDIAGFASLIGD